MPEALLLGLALAAYGSAGLAAWRRIAVGMALPLFALGVLLHTGALGLRWAALGHGPFTTLHEILSSNLWSLSLVLALAAATRPEVRAAWPAALPVLAVLAGWLALSDASPGHLPPTYATPLLYLHTLVGKLYLGLLLVAVALGARAWWPGDAARSDELAYRFAAVAFVFDTLMLIVGAAWAQDAWGRYWAWDPLETWAFASWLALAAALHARAALRPAPRRHAVWLAAVFGLAFLTFFGVPFVSTAPHQGAL
ncbi:MAG: cytochrome c biogenesis protein CcsA [Piscinibacter sp.]|nr:cytochrome c biogenesis protein CcsA [Piscinibacter sp.]